MRLPKPRTLREAAARAASSFLWVVEVASAVYAGIQEA
jgi:hypothetical protein